MKKGNGYKLIKRGLALLAVPIVLTGCGTKKSNTTTKVISETIISQDATDIAATTNTKNVTSTTGYKTTTVYETTTSTTETTSTTTMYKDEYELFANASKYDKTVSEWLDLISKDHDINQVNEISDIILKNNQFDGTLSTSSSAAFIAKECVSYGTVRSVKKALETSNIQDIDNINISDEEKEKYIYIYKLYNAYINAYDNKNAYLMINNCIKIFNEMINIDSFILKNKITDEERLNYFISYSNGETKESNLFLGESLLKDYFERMRYYVTQENYTEFCYWSSTQFALENIFSMLEEEFKVEKINGKYVALKLEQNVITTETTPNMQR